MVLVRSALAVLLVLLAASDAMTIWPKPSQQTWAENSPEISLSAAFDFKASGQDSKYLRDAFTRYLGIMFGSRAKDGGNTAGITAKDGEIQGCNVTVISPDLSLTLETDESYTLTVASPRITLTAKTVFGAIRGLESLSQLVSPFRTVNATTVTDAPRFQFRAFMIDTSRHFYPLNVILQHLDAMAYSKMNVLHWHITDSVSFPMEFVTFPELADTGAFSPSHHYTQDDIQQVIDYAFARGIRVLPEFDTPGHMDAGFKNIPNLLTECYDKDGKKDGTTGELTAPSAASADTVF
jgi:hexosaminidase